MAICGGFLWSSRLKLFFWKPLHCSILTYDRLLAIEIDTSSECVSFIFSSTAIMPDWCGTGFKTNLVPLSYILIPEILMIGIGRETHLTAMMPSNFLVFIWKSFNDKLLNNRWHYLSFIFYQVVALFLATWRLFYLKTLIESTYLGSFVGGDREYFNISHSLLVGSHYRADMEGSSTSSDAEKGWDGGQHSLDHPLPALCRTRLHESVPRYKSQVDPYCWRCTGWSPIQLHFP